MGIRILLADDHKMFVEGLCSMLSGEEDIIVLARAENGREAVCLAERLRPDVVVLDINMPGLNGIEAARQILKNNPDTRVIALSIYSSRRFVTGMLQAGATGYLVKDCAFEELASAIRLVAKNQTYLSQKIHGVLVKDYITGTPVRDSGITSLLTQREREILQLVAEGERSEDISAKLFISVKTVNSHRQSIMRKLRVKNTAGLTKFAIKEGLILIDD